MSTQRWVLLGIGMLVSAWTVDAATGAKPGPKATPTVVEAPCCVCIHRGGKECASLTVRKDTLRQVYKGATYYFCDPTCKILFRRDPEKFLKPRRVQ